MSGHAIGQIKNKTASAADHVVEGPVAHHPCREELSKEIEQLHALSRRGLWGLILFLSLSAVALCLNQAGAWLMVPAEIKEMVGPSPPAELLHVALGVSWFSALVLVLGRRGADGKPGYNWYNIGLPAAFYPLYIFADPTGTCFPAVFAAGLVLLLLEHAFVISYTGKEIRKETQRLQAMPE